MNQFSEVLRSACGKDLETVKGILAQRITCAQAGCSTALTFCMEGSVPDFTTSVDVKKIEMSRSMRQKLVTIVLSVGLISGIGIVSTGNASAAVVGSTAATLDIGVRIAGFFAGC